MSKYVTLLPAQFTLLVDLPSRILSKAKSEGKISGVKVSRTSPRISHLMYANDLLIYCKADMDEALGIKACLDQYCEWTGQRINWEKSEIHFSPNVSRAKRIELCHSLSMKECTHSGKYLGSPFCKILL